MKHIALLLSVGATLVSCEAMYRPDGRAQVLGGTIYSRPLPAVHGQQATPQVQYVYVEAPARARKGKKAARTTQVRRVAPQPQIIYVQAPEPPPGPVPGANWEDPYSEIPAWLLEQPAGHSGAQVPAGHVTN